MQYSSKTRGFQPLRPDEIVPVVIGPFGKFSDDQRREIEKGTLVQFSIAADEGIGSPSAFDRSTLHWVFRQSDVVVICAGDMPSDPDKQQSLYQLFRLVLEPHCVPGGRTAIVNVRSDDVAQWLEYVNEHCRPNTPTPLIFTSAEVK